MLYGQIGKAFKATFAAATLAMGLLASPGAAVAAPMFLDIEVGDFVLASDTLDPLGTATFTFTALEDLEVGAITLAGVGTNSGDDLAQVRFGFTSPPSTGYTTFTPSPTTASAAGSLPGLSMFVGESFTIFWESIAPAASDSVVISARFDATAPTVVPVPAALPLLASGVAVLFGLARRKG